MSAGHPTTDAGTHQCPRCRVVYFAPQECDWCAGQQAAPLAAAPDDELGTIWWNALDRVERGYWLSLAQSATPADAWAEFRRPARELAA